MFDWALNKLWMLNCFQIDLLNWICCKRKVKKEIATSSWWPQIAPDPSFEGPLGDVLRTSWERPESVSQGRPLKVRLRRPLDIISGRPQDVRGGRPWDSQIESLGDVLGRLEENVLRTSWGPIFRVLSLIIRGNETHNHLK